MAGSDEERPSAGRLRDHLTGPRSFRARLDEELEKAEAEYGDADPERLQLAVQNAHVIAASAWIRERWGEHKRCPYCANREWWVGYPTHLESQGVREVWVYPVTCRYCGHAVLINPSLADLQRPVEGPDR